MFTNRQGHYSLALMGANRRAVRTAGIRLAEKARTIRSRIKNGMLFVLLLQK